ncbi:helix-turn-helix transcriptional regulator [Bradyrhizobium diazoefficiens]|uniref:helix-turn-helix transcriptional regulator n=1 Tax=Bradyrhizobium diazoefficiens TaxID=1355477 RepID=UPI0015B76788|nr:WYL domain-containing protein [Bradyrhizobium diazoefficiens]QLD45623.1 WYL domain-containing protein [Bradyrhizobium diazoefficiens]
MSFEKAQQLLDLATFVMARRAGVTLDDVKERFAISRRTAQRMMQVLETLFPDTTAAFDEQGHKRWQLQTGALRDLMTLSPDELAALDLAIETLAKTASGVEAAELQRLKEKVLALAPRRTIARVETDHEALLEAQGLASRPGPAARIRPEIAAVISTAIKSSCRLRITYFSHARAEPVARMVEPYGVLIGIRRYLVARAKEDPDGPLRHFVAERIEAAELTDESFVRDAGFDMHDYAQKAFGAFQNDAEFGPVVWRFTPEAADHARAFVFHPRQAMEDQKDGSLIVRFSASGHLEMCWHLYMWGNKVEVLAPESLRKMIEGFRRGDFAALP